ncbi:MAG: hemolysin III family protein [Lachnospiraceae bacterium]|nr:hemolysin III family protein [Lachnospiraceae bacterium]MDY5742591.1 hemolysin III family protein [Lachnospiraceae bacterium]
MAMTKSHSKKLSRSSLEATARTYQSMREGLSKQAADIKKSIVLKDFWSAVTHMMGIVMTASIAPFMLFRAAGNARPIPALLSAGIYLFSMLLLYTASTVYHSLDLGFTGNTRLKRFDHLSIFALIAGSYTPLCVLALPQPLGYRLLAVVWSIALLGMGLKLFWIYCPKWVSSVLYIAMGWVCAFALPSITKVLSTVDFLLLLFGGLSFTVGGIIYGIKWHSFDAGHPNFGTHEIFHLFVLLGSILQFICFYHIF